MGVVIKDGSSMASTTVADRDSLSSWVAWKKLSKLIGFLLS